MSSSGNGASADGHGSWQVFGSADPFRPGHARLSPAQVIDGALPQGGVFLASGVEQGTSDALKVPWSDVGQACCFLS